MKINNQPQITAQHQAHPSFQGLVKFSTAEECGKKVLHDLTKAGVTLAEDRLEKTVFLEVHDSEFERGIAAKLKAAGVRFAHYVGNFTKKQSQDMKEHLRIG